LRLSSHSSFVIDYGKPLWSSLGDKVREKKETYQMYRRWGNLRFKKQGFSREAVQFNNEITFLGLAFKGASVRWSDKAFAEFKRRVKELTGRRWGGRFHEIPARQAGRIRSRLDGLFWDIGVLSLNPGNGSLAAPQGAHVLLETVAILPHQGSRADETRHLSADRYFGRYEPERPLATLTHPGNPIRHDQSMAQESRSAVCQRTVGKHPLPGYGPVAHENRIVRTRMLCGVVRGRVKLPLTRFATS